MQMLCLHSHHRHGRPLRRARVSRIQPVVAFANGGATTADNLEARCRAHNAYEAERWFGMQERIWCGRVRPLFRVCVSLQCALIPVPRCATRLRPRSLIDVLAHITVPTLETSAARGERKVGRDRAAEGFIRRGRGCECQIVVPHAGKPQDTFAGQIMSPSVQCTNVRTSEKASSPDLLMDHTRQDHSPRVDQSWPAEMYCGTPRLRGRIRNRRASSW